MTSFNFAVDEVISSPNITVNATIMLFTVCSAAPTSRPLVFHAKNPITRPETNTSKIPKLLYPCAAAKIMAWMTSTKIGFLNHDPNDCIIKPRNMYSSAIHCKGTSTMHMKRNSNEK